MLVGRCSLGDAGDLRSEDALAPEGAGDRSTRKLSSAAGERNPAVNGERRNLGICSGRALLGVTAFCHLPGCPEAALMRVAELSLAEDRGRHLARLLRHQAVTTIIIKNPVGFLNLLTADQAE